MVFLVSGTVSYMFTLYRYKEVCDYDFNTGKSANGKDVGHFTQVAWKESLELGMGRATKGDCTYVVGRYKPPGNLKGKEKENVFKGTFDKSFCKSSKWVPSSGGSGSGEAVGDGGDTPGVEEVLQEVGGKNDAAWQT